MRSCSVHCSQVYYTSCLVPAVVGPSKYFLEDDRFLGVRLNISITRANSVTVYEIVPNDPASVVSVFLPLHVDLSLTFVSFALLYFF